MTGSVSSPIPARQPQYGDKPPEITRKITACAACRKQKVKCFMGRDGQPPCTRCKKRGLPCAVNKSLQMILESDADWKSSVERKIRTLESGLARVANHLSLDDVFDDVDEADDEPMELPPPAASDGVSPQVEKHTPHNFEIVMDPNSGPAAIPGSVVSPVILPGLDQRMEQDIIHRKVVTIDEARNYLNVYQNRLDHFLYRILGDRRSLEQVRKSPLLLAAVCAVGALHTADSPHFETCYQEFVSIAAAQTFSRRNTVDDIRGLCIAAFWLSGISWTCVAAAVRISTEIGLHRSIYKALAGERNHYLRTRLYYLVYVCDHHFSVAYGRPPMTRQDDAVRASMPFLESDFADEDDSRLVSQVQFWNTGSKIYETFGIDVEKPLNLSMIEPLRRLSIDLDGIRADWTEKFTANKFVGNYPRKGVGLHYHFMRLYLHSMAFRGIGKPGFRSPDVALDIDELANSALLSATAILRAVVMDEEIQSYLNGLPTYFDLMLAFAVVFVLKVSTKYASSVRIDTSEIRSLVADLVTVLKGVTSSMHPRHLLVSVTHGAETLLDKCSGIDLGMPSNAQVTMSQPTFDQSLYDVSNEWNGASFDNFFMGEFDFLSNQENLNGFLPDSQYQQM
ncbi:Hypothetical protein R9X50_00198000 [Acrodontium crateriforme]|uniref:Zn(2)-C6 fungal-type domain-containing protein n=1 Tax=Acrodontium crateriforme TaxID=150365 RepID=A0AAQ3M0A6_9PEZI|nr:Hypothetical protein R9X50_00198000 [Acrodontium crateriforme]